jgi:high-affinity Fe2+/Pb2+ permease
MDAFLNSPLGAALGTILGLVAAWLIIAPIWWWLHRRDERRWAVQAQIREESMSEEWREWHRQWRAQQAEIHREARRRLGLPEEDSPTC